jgi:hypothetical protein
VKMWSGFTWFWIRSNGGLLWTQQWTFRFHKRTGISWPTELLPASPGLCSIKLVKWNRAQKEGTGYIHVYLVFKVPWPSKVQQELLSEICI